jgi:hypothetical protein
MVVVESVGADGGVSDTGAGGGMKIGSGGGVKIVGAMRLGSASRLGRNWRRVRRVAVNMIPIPYEF